MIDLEIIGYEITPRRAAHRLGIVHHAVWQDNQRAVELLLLDPSLRHAADFEQRFLDAARGAMRLRDNIRGIVKPTDADVYDGRLFLARSPSAGDNLDDYLIRLQKRGAAVPLDTLHKTLLAVALRLRVLHGYGIVHGNLTPAALTASTHAGLLMTDLGLPSLNVQEAMGLPHGTSQILPFLSPEQMLGRGVGEATDIFAFGVVAYALATGQLPRAGSLWKEGLKSYWGQTPALVHERRPEVGPQLSAIIHKALSIRPQNRFRSAAELVHALQAVMLGKARTAHASAAPDKTAYAAALINESGAEALAISVRPDSLEVAPGDEAVLYLTVANHSVEPTGYSITVHGVPGQWVNIPHEIDPLAPGAVAEITVRLAVPPDSSAESGDRKVRIEVTTSGQAAQTQANESLLTILSVRELFAEMEPQHIHQGQSVSLTLRNGGNEPLRVTVKGRDANDRLRFSGEVGDMELAAGAMTTLALRVAARSQPLAGRVHEVPFSVIVRSEDGIREQELEGYVTVAPVIPAWLSALLIIFLITLCAAGTVWLWPRFVGVPGGGADNTPVAAATSTASATASATIDVTATDALDAALATIEGVETSATSTPTSTATPQEITATATVPPARPTVTSTPLASPTSEEPSLSGGEIAIHVSVAEGDEIWSLSREGGEPNLLLSDAREPAWSPDGRRIAFARPDEDEDPQSEILYVASASGTQLNALTEEAMQIGGFSWSPDGSQIAYHAAPAGANETSDYQIFIAQSDGSGARQLTTDADGYANMWPLWSPAGNEILANGVPQSRGAAAQLRLYNTQNQNMTVWFTGDDMQLNMGEYDWSPEGAQVVFSVTGDENVSQLFVLDAAVPLITPLTSGSGSANWPSWSPNGQRIAFIAGDDENQEAVAVVRATGEAEQTIVSARSLEALSWSPDGNELAIAGDFDGDGAVQLWIVDISEAEPVALLDDLSQLSVDGPVGAATPEFMAVAWRPRVP